MDVEEEGPAGTKKTGAAACNHVVKSIYRHKTAWKGISFRNSSFALIEILVITKGFAGKQMPQQMLLNTES